MLKSDFSEITAMEKATPIFPYFEKYMKGRAFGKSETLAAWLAFKAGWQTLDRKLGTEATDWWCDHD